VLPSRPAEAKFLTPEQKSWLQSQLEAERQSASAGHSGHGSSAIDMTTGPFVILTSKRGLFRTEVGAGIEPVEAYDYLFCGQPRARFVIARLDGEPRITIVDEAPPPVVNVLPSAAVTKGRLGAELTEIGSRMKAEKDRLMTVPA